MVSFRRVGKKGIRLYWESGRLALEILPAFSRGEILPARPFQLHVLASIEGKHVLPDQGLVIHDSELYGPWTMPRGRFVLLLTVVRIRNLPGLEDMHEEAH